MVDDMKRPDPESAGIPEIHQAPGMADELMRELEPLLAAQGIDLPAGQTVDGETLQRALATAIERRSMALFHPAGRPRELAVEILRKVVGAILDGNAAHAADLLEGAVVPESHDGSTATTTSCIGISLGLLDSWFSGEAHNAPAGLAKDTTLPSGHWNSEQAATDILTLARKGGAASATTSLIGSHGGIRVLFGSALALTAATGTWAKSSNVPPADLIRTVIR